MVVQATLPCAARVSCTVRQACQASGTSTPSPFKLRSRLLLSLPPAFAPSLESLQLRSSFASCVDLLREGAPSGAAAGADSDTAWAQSATTPTRAATSLPRDAGITRCSRRRSKMNG
eukprot:575809-Pelagomonas_calceolata.AAC.1